MRLVKIKFEELNKELEFLEESACLKICNANFIALEFSKKL